MANIQTNTRNTYYAVLALTEQSQNNAANSTTLAYALTLYNGKTSFSGYTIGYRVKIDGVQVAYHDNSGAQTSMGWNEAKLLVSGTTTVLHDDNGNKTVSVEIEVWTDVNQYLPIYISGSGTVALTQILRESTISATDANIGAVSMIAINRKSSGYTHSIAYTFGALSGYITADGGVSPAEIKLSATYIGWSIPAGFYGMIPNNKVGDCTLTCKTYSGDTQIGSAKTFTIRCTAAESLCAPVVTGTVVDTNEAVTALTGSSAKLVRYISNALCTISAAARNSATIKQKRIAGQAITDTSRTISAMELESVIFESTDSRGYTSTAVVAVDLVPYIKLTCRAVTARLTPTGDKVQLDISGSYFNGSFGAADNALTIKYRVSGSSAWQEITPVIDGNNYTASAVLSGLAYNQVHTLSISAADKLSTVQISDTIKRGVPIFDWGEEDFEFHVPVSFQGKSLAEMLDLAGDDITGKLPIEKGGTGATSVAQALENLGALPRTGGRMTNTTAEKGIISHPGNSSGWGNSRDNAIILRRDAVTDLGKYFPLLASKTVAGNWAVGTLANNLYVNFDLDTDYNAGNNRVDQQFWFGSDGNLYLPGGRAELAVGTLGANASATVSAWFDGTVYKNLLVFIRSYVNGIELFTSYAFPAQAGTWGLFLPTYNDYYRATVVVTGNGGGGMRIIVQMDSNYSGGVCYIYATM